MRSDFTSEEIKKAQHDANRDMLSGAPGSHPVGTGVGAVTGGVLGGVAGGVATGAAMGTVVGPVGTAAGAAVGVVVGAVAGGLAGKTLAEDIDPTVEHGFWRSNYIGRPYIIQGTPYEEYAPAYQYGWETRLRYHDKTFEQSEPILAREWARHRGKSTLNWEHAKHAVRDSWERVSHRKRSSSK